MAPNTPKRRNLASPPPLEMASFRFNATGVFKKAYIAAGFAFAISLTLLVTHSHAHSTPHPVSAPAQRATSMPVGGGGERGGATKPSTAPAPASQPATRSAEQKKQDDINRVMEFFRITQPDVFEQARTLRDSDPAKFEKLISGAIPTVNWLESVKKRNPKLFDLSMQDLTLGYESLRIAHELKHTDLELDYRNGLMDRLNLVVAKEFDVQQKIRQIEIDDLRQKVREMDNPSLRLKLRDLDTQGKARQDDKANIIRKRIEDLIERTPRLEW